METLITYLRARIKECIKEANRANPKIKERIKKSINERINANGVCDLFNLWRMNVGSLKKNLFD